jgi:hypothetical protein
MYIKLAKYAGAIGTGLGIAGMVSADAFSTTTAVTLANSLTSDVATIIGGAIGAILGLMAGLLGLGWAVRKFKSKVSGKKF